MTTVPHLSRRSHQGDSLAGCLVRRAEAAAGGTPGEPRRAQGIPRTRSTAGDPFLIPPGVVHIARRRTFDRSDDSRIACTGLRKITVHDAGRTCASLLVDLDLHPRVAMAIVRHADFPITMGDRQPGVPAATREALRRLGESLDP